MFSPNRAMRMDWILIALADPKYDCFQGWNRKKAFHDPTRRVTVVIDNFVVVIGIWQARNKLLKANFITCYQANNSIKKIRRSPRWTLQDCLNTFQR